MEEGSCTLSISALTLVSEMTRELMTLGDSQTKALELADGSYGSYGMGKEELQIWW